MSHLRLFWGLDNQAGRENACIAMVYQQTKGNLMKAVTFLVAMLIGIGTTASSRAAETPSPDIFQTSVEVLIPDGASFGQALITTTPSDKRLVIQSVSVQGSGVVASNAGSTVQLFLATNIFNTFTDWLGAERRYGVKPFELAI
jgi:hypothetical protein